MNIKYIKITSPIFLTMFTANLAGSAGSHLRPDRDHGHGHRDSNTHSRMNLHEIDQLGSDEEAIKRLQAAHNKDGNTERIEVDPERMQSLLNEYRRKRCQGDYKSWAYMTCVGLVVLAAIVLVILAAMGHLNLDSSS